MSKIHNLIFQASIQLGMSDKYWNVVGMWLVCDCSGIQTVYEQLKWKILVCKVIYVEICYVIGIRPKSHRKSYIKLFLLSYKALSA